jgi:hypothetical protein
VLSSSVQPVTFRFEADTSRPSTADQVITILAAI